MKLSASCGERPSEPLAGSGSFVACTAPVVGFEIRRGITMRLHPLARLAHFLWVVCALLSATAGRAQMEPYLVGWGAASFDSRASSAVYSRITVTLDRAVWIRPDGVAIASGVLSASPPQLPPGVRYVDCSIGFNGHYAAVRSDGLIEQWFGDPQPVYAIPSLPTGITYTSVAVSSWVAAAVRSDGQIVTWGRDASISAYTPPAPPIGGAFVKVVAGGGTFAAMASDGRTYTWGAPGLSPPTPPPGVTVIDIAAGFHHVLQLRSDGMVDAFGLSNAFGEMNVPALPTSTTYTAVGAGLHTSYAQRSDGSWVGWGNNSRGQTNIPAPPGGMTYTQVAGGHLYGTALRSDGAVVGWGAETGFAVPLPTPSTGSRYIYVSAYSGHGSAITDTGTIAAFGSSLYGVTTPPPLPSGMRYEAIATGFAHHAAIRSDGSILTWGWFPWVVPALPAGLTYTKLDAGHSHLIALRSDGLAMEVGNSYSSTSAPAPPPAGTRYIDVTAAAQGNLCTLSDGVMVAFGTNTSGRFNIPAAPPGTAYRKGVAGAAHAVGLLDTGNIVQWGAPIGSPGPAAPPPLPYGVVYVDIRSGHDFVLARRSDGTLVHWGNNQWHVDRIPPIPTGMACLEIHTSQGSQCSAIYGPRSTYITFANGCAGTRPATRLIPHDVPRIGKTLVVQLFDLPTHTALLAFGWNRRIQPLDLTPYGLTGCSVHIDFDAVRFLAGADHTARFELPIPYATALIGLEFHHQALVLDPTANPAGAIASDAAHAVVGG